MNQEDLFEVIGQTKEELLEQSERKPKKLMAMLNYKSLVAVACVVVLLVGIVDYVSFVMNGSYRYVARGENSYLVLGSAKVSTGGSVSSLEIAPIVYFSSMAEMKSDIESGNFTEEEQKEISRFSRDERGNVRICDLENLYEPLYPEMYQIEYISWSGGGYAYRLSTNHARESVRFSLLSEKRTNELMNTFNDPDYGYNGCTAEAVPELNGMAYYFSGMNGTKSVAIHYTVENGDTILYVRKFYYIHYEPQVGNINNKSLRGVEIHGVKDGQWFVFSIDSIAPGSMIVIDEKSDDELKAFGIRKFTDTE